MNFNRINVPYQVDDSNIDCGRILITTCDPYVHEYVDPCSIVSDCLDNLWRPTIDRCSMLDIDWAGPGAFLRVNNSGDCVEFIDPDTVFATYNTDKQVAIDDAGTPGYLEDKIISTDNTVTITPNGDALDLSTGWGDSFFDLSDVPATPAGHDGAILKVDGNQLVFVDDDTTQRGVRYMIGDQTYVGVQGLGERRFLDTSYYEWNPAMPWTQILPTGTLQTITVQKTGMYRIWMNGGFNVNRCVDAVKAVMITTEPWDKSILLASKVGWMTSYGVAGLALPDTDRGQNRAISSFSESGLVKLTKNTVISMAIRISGAVPELPWHEPEVVIEWATHVQWSFGTGNEVIRNKYCGTQFGIARYWSSMHNAV